MVRKGPELPRLVIDKLAQLTKRVVLVNAVPYLPKDASREGMRKGSRQPFFEPLEKKRERESANSVVAGLEGGRVTVLDASKFFINKDLEIVSLNERGQCRYHDSGHLSAHGAAELFGDFVSILTPSP
jgi:hypothetical protein